MKISKNLYIYYRSDIDGIIINKNVFYVACYVGNVD